MERRFQFRFVSRWAITTCSAVLASKHGYALGNKSAVITRKRSAAELAAIRQQKAEAAARAKAAARATFLAGSRTIPYNDLEKSAESYQGKKIKVYGKILQIQQSPYGGGVMLVSVTNEGYGFWDDNVWVDYAGKIPQNEDDLITLYGTVTGSKSYKTQAGGETYVPWVRAKYIEGVN